MNDAQSDARLRALLAPPDAFPDEIFTARVGRAILAEERLRAARRRARRRFAVELTGSAAALLTFYMLGSLAPDRDILAFGPALAGLMLIGIWTLVGMRPAVDH